MAQEIATIGGGCFWCLEAIFRELQGVEKVVSGYSGGNVPNPSYQTLCTGTTGHAEVVQITFDPMIISFRIVTELTPFKVFYPAEEYHQEYLRRNPDQMYCSLVIKPKLAHLRKKYFGKLKNG